jgi:4-hydroxy-3-methylbut-2-enyl diphosphate reductase
MLILRAQHLGMCFGVKRAIAQATAAAERAPLTILGDLVHNDLVLHDLQARGIRSRHEIEEIETATVMITAHGASERRLAQLNARSLHVLNATCPLVAAAHKAVALLVSEGCHPVIVGRRDHAEVRGLTEDLHAFDVVLADEDVECLEERPAFGIAAQTTQPVERLHRIATLVQERFPTSRVEVMNTVCLPTILRQRSAEELARVADLVLVIGGARSNNPRELVATCQRYCTDVFHVQSAADVRAEWFGRAAIVGITAGTSTPDEVIDAVDARVRTLARVTAAA